MKEVLGMYGGRGSWYDGVEDEMATRNPDITDDFDNSVNEQAKLEWLRAAVKKGLDEIEAGQGIEFSSIEEAEAEIDRIADEVERSFA